MNIFVHPLHPEKWYDGTFPFNKKKGMYEVYKQNLKRIEKENDVILIKPIGSTIDNFFDKIDDSRFIYSGHLNDSNGERSHNTGFVASSMFEKFDGLLEGLDKGSNLIIHGAYLNNCVSEFAQQLFFRIEKGVWLFDVKDINNLIKSHFKRFLAERKGEFLKSNIRYGHVLAQEMITIDIHNKKIPSLLYPYGDFDYQLIDENSRIYI